MDVEKFIYTTTTQGNYNIIKVIMEPQLDLATNEIVFKIKRNNRRRRVYYFRICKVVWKKDECFDSRADAMQYAATQIQNHRDKIIAQQQHYIDYCQKRIDKLKNKPPRCNHLDWTR